MTGKRNNKHSPSSKNKKDEPLDAPHNVHEPIIEEPPSSDDDSSENSDKSPSVRDTSSEKGDDEDQQSEHPNNEGEEKEEDEVIVDKIVEKPPTAALHQLPESSPKLDTIEAKKSMNPSKKTKGKGDAHPQDAKPRKTGETTEFSAEFLKQVPWASQFLNAFTMTADTGEMRATFSSIQTQLTSISSDLRRVSTTLEEHSKTFQEMQKKSDTIMTASQIMLNEQSTALKDIYNSWNKGKNYVKDAVEQNKSFGKELHNLNAFLSDIRTTNEKIASAISPELRPITASIWRIPKKTVDSPSTSDPQDNVASHRMPPREHQEVNRCAFCANPHETIRCQKFFTWQARRQLLLREKGCFLCLQKAVCQDGEPHVQCPAAQELCETCEIRHFGQENRKLRRHHPAICEMFKNNREGASQPPYKRQKRERYHKD
ncbi:unnamed protein product [Caenorhabditis brenneri]